ncbi:MAG: IS21 family transposase, partial [Actinobacteria bacterium QS_5_72_10]
MSAARCGVGCTTGELVITAHTDRGLVEIARHALSTPGSPQIADAHYPAHDPRGGRKDRPQPTPTTEAERAFLALGDGAQQWLIEAGAAGVESIPTKMGRAVELACVVGDELVDRALG